MAFALVTNGAAGLGVNGGTALNLNTTGADLLISHVNYETQTLTGSDFTDSKSNTWIKLTSHLAAATYPGSVFFYAKNPTVGSGHTFTFTKTSSYSGMSVMAWSGSDLTAPFDVENGATGASGTSQATGSVTPNQANSLIVAGLSINAGYSGGAPTINSSFTQLNSFNYNAAQYDSNTDAYFVQGSAGAINPTWSWSGTSNSHAASIAVFKPATAPSGTTRSYGYVF